VISAPSGAGKTTLCKMLVSEMEKAVFSVSLTSRKPRGAEKRGVDYEFVTEKEFKKRINEKTLLEWARVHGAYYGTSGEFVKRSLNKGKCVVLDIDVQGGMQVKRKIPEAVLIFILPPSMEELKRRLRKRRQNSEEEIEKRLENAYSEVEAAHKYDYYVLNRELKDAIAELKSIVKAQERKLKIP